MHEMKNMCFSSLSGIKQMSLFILSRISGIEIFINTIFFLLLDSAHRIQKQIKIEKMVGTLRSNGIMVENNNHQHISKCVF